MYNLGYSSRRPVIEIATEHKIFCILFPSKIISDFKRNKREQNIFLFFLALLKYFKKTRVMRPTAQKYLNFKIKLQIEISFMDYTLI